MPRPSGGERVVVIANQWRADTRACTSSLWVWYHARHGWGPVLVNAKERPSVNDGPPC